MKINEIQIGDRVRKDMGDLEALAESIKRHGLLHPVVVKSDGTLIAGHRRIAALQLMGQEDIPVTVIEVEDLLSAERDENVERKDFTPTEAVAIGLLIEERLKPLQFINKISNLNNAIVESNESIPSTKKVIPAQLGMGVTKYYQAKAVVAAAKEDPEQFGDLPQQMDETGNVSGAHTEMKRRKNGEGRHPVFKKMKYLDGNEQIQKSVWALEGICNTLQSSQGPFDQEKIEEWSKSLRKSASIISQTARRIHGKAA